jgi:hypothetical protein
MLFAIYLKFYYNKINAIEQWEHILDEIDYDNIDVYIWIFYELIYTGNITNIFDFEHIKQIIAKYPKIKFVSNCNETNYLTQDEQLYLRNIYDTQTKFITNDWKGHTDSHLKSFIIPKNVEYIFNIDADDIFYPNFKISYFYDCVNFIKENNLLIITRSYHQCMNRGWSFGFTLANKNILEYMDISNYIQNDAEFTCGPLTDSFHVRNLDNLFGEIFHTKYNLKHNIQNLSLNEEYKNLFFKLDSYDWINYFYGDKEIENNYIHENNCLIIKTTE